MIGMAAAAYERGNTMAKRYLLALVLSLFACCGYGADPLQHLLDGISCPVQMSQNGSPKDKDILVFADGTGSAPGLAKAYQFDPGPYAATKAGQKITFSFTVTSAEHGKVEFTGVITGTTVTGKRVWSKNDNKPIEFTFTGTVTHP